MTDQTPAAQAPQDVAATVLATVAATAPVALAAATATNPGATAAVQAAAIAIQMLANAQALAKAGAMTPVQLAALWKQTGAGVEAAHNAWMASGQK